MAESSAWVSRNWLLLRNKTVRIAPHVGFITGLTCRPEILSKTQKEVEVRGLKNVNLRLLLLMKSTPQTESASM